jgi:hypothetical protein
VPYGEEDAFKGLIDEPRVYDETLGEAEIEEDMESPIRTPEQLVAENSDAIISGSGDPSPTSSIGGFPYSPTTTLAQSAGTNNTVITGSGTRGGISFDAAKGMWIGGLSGLPFAITPSSLVEGEHQGQRVAGGDAIAYAEVKAGTDMLNRPIRDGLVSYLIFHKEANVEPFSWKLDSPYPLKLAERKDGGVDVSIEPPAEVRSFSSKALEEGGLSSESQIVATIAPPEALDASAKNVPAALSVKGSEISLSLTPKGASFRVEAEVSIHTTGPLVTFDPVSEESQVPSDVFASTIGVEEDGTSGPVESQWSTSAKGTNVTIVMPDENNELTAATSTVTPGSSIESITTVHALTGSYRPMHGPPKRPRCFLFCVGNVICSAQGPVGPYGPPVQTYALIYCNLQGSKPPKFSYVNGGACLQRRFGINGQVLWATEKCNNIGPNYSPNWNTAAFVAKGCSSGGVWRGEAWVSVVFTDAVSTSGSITANNFRC